MKTTIYAKINHSFFNVSILGDNVEVTIPKGFVLMAENRPDINYIALDNGDGTGTWVIDENYWKKQNQPIVDALKLEASQEIETLKYAISSGKELDGDKDKLIAWENYRLSLSRVNTNVEEIQLPEKPKA